MVDEQALGFLAKSASSPKFEIKKLSISKKAIRSCISQGFRSAYFTAKLAEAHMRNGAPQEGLHSAVLQQMKLALENRYRSFSNWRFVVIRNLNEDLLINEQPFRDWTLHKKKFPFITMPLAPRAILFGEPSSTGQFSIEWVDREDKYVDVSQHNDFIVSTARHFVAAWTEKQLDSVIPHLTRELVEDRAATDRMVALSEDEEE